MRDGISRQSPIGYFTAVSSRQVLQRLLRDGWFRVLAAEALRGWLASSLAHGDVPKVPSKRRRGRVILVSVPANLAVKLALRWARHEEGLTQAQLAQRAGLSQAIIAKVESPEYRPSLDVLEAVAAALGRKVRVELEAA
jgi:DNA-binding XRE family transcriptional regulator